MLFWPESFLIICLNTLSGLRAGVSGEKNLWWHRKHELSKQAAQAQQSKNSLSVHFCCPRHFPTYGKFSKTQKSFAAFCLDIFPASFSEGFWLLWILLWTNEFFIYCQKICLSFSLPWKNSKTLRNSHRKVFFRGFPKESRWRVRAKLPNVSILILLVK